MPAVLRCSWCARLVASAVAVLLIVLPWAARAAAPEEPSFDALMAEAKEQRAAGAHAEAAALHARAYRRLSAKQQTKLKGEIVIQAAISDYRAALEAGPETIEEIDAQLELLGAEQALLDEFVGARTREPPAPDIVEELDGIGPRVEALEQQRAPGHDVVLEAGQRRCEPGVRAQLEHAAGLALRSHQGQPLVDWAQHVALHVDAGVAAQELLEP
ncbi:MAG: hypothetical protein KDK70_12815 [Myxococcales bacterium]|nr:hypothetical protein [Myxococcales bacterium]